MLHCKPNSDWDVRMSDYTSTIALPRETVPAWGAVVSMMLGVFGLVTAEFLPASLLSPMARDLGVTEGLAGQAVTTTAVLALVTSLLVTSVIRSLDRRLVLMSFSVLLIASNLLVAGAPSLGMLLLARMLLGVALGGFWTMSVAVTMRLVPMALIPRALSILFSGVSAATIFAAPFGSYVGSMAGWRDVFLMAAVLGGLALMVQFLTLPRMVPEGATPLRTLLALVRRPRMALGILAILLVFSAHFAFFTYMRPFLETITGVGAAGMAGIFLAFGIANFFGTMLGGVMLERKMRLTMVVLPLLMAVVGLGLAIFGHTPIAATALVALWGLAFGAMPVAWSTWMTRTVPDEAESGGGLLVATIQFAIAAGAALGGAVFDRTGVTSVFILGGVVSLAAVGIVLAVVRPAAPVES
jgi:predicted MFS family arabinose efflux permease